jgi:hypothetical protein
MAHKRFTREQAVEYIKSRQGNLTVEEYAEKLGISSVQLRSVYRGIRSPGIVLGFRKVKESVRYERIEE